MRTNQQGKPSYQVTPQTAPVGVEPAEQEEVEPAEQEEVEPAEQEEVEPAEQEEVELIQLMYDEQVAVA